ncbi:hypothetical protein F5051DRAFT_141220 [Lentinula edodes]|nr:hypothetical protein F5051DRAFT_141220 [Lentinula edodes]
MLTLWKLALKGVSEASDSAYSLLSSRLVRVYVGSATRSDALHMHPFDFLNQSHYEKAILPENIIPAAHLNNPVSTSFGHDVQPATTGPVLNVSLSCLEAARQEVLAEATQLVGNRNASRLRAVVTAEDIQMELAETNRIAVKIMCATVVGMAGLIVFTVWASTKCPSNDNCKSWRRRDNVNKIEQCKHLDVSACRNPSPTRTLSKPVTSGEHGKRDVMRMSYRRRLERE